MIECKYCKTKIKNLKLIPPHLRWCKKYKKWKDAVLTYEFIYHEYVVLEKSANQIALELGFCTSAVINKRVTQLGINKRGIAQSKIMPKCLERTKQTNIERWGYEHNFNKNHPSRIAWEQRLWDEEGITNVFQRDDVKLKITEHIKLNGRCVRGSRISQIHKYIYDMLIAHDILCENEFPIKQEIHYMSFYDIKILDTNILIEINGDLYHANPQFYKSTDVVFLPGSKTLKPVQEFWDKDERKRILAEKNSYKVETLWEYDIIHNHEKIRTKLNNILVGIGYETNKIKENYKNFKRVKPLRCTSS